jgi:hypothetical protein
MRTGTGMWACRREVVSEHDKRCQRPPHAAGGGVRRSVLPHPPLHHHHHRPYLSAPPMTMAAVSSLSRLEKAASSWHTLQIALSLVMLSARGMRFTTVWKGCDRQPG